MGLLSYYAEDCAKVKKDIFKHMRFYLNQESSAKLYQQLQLFLHQWHGLNINNERAQVMNTLHKQQENNN